MTNQGRVALQPAYILHRKPYRETSLLLEAFTADVGRIGLVARGARRSKSSSQALLQPFVPLWLSWSGHGELGTMTGVEGRSMLRPLTGKALISGFYLNELLLRLLQRYDPHPELFAVYDATLQQLATESSSHEWTLRLFEKALLQEMGYGLLFDHEAHSGEAIQPDQRYCYHLQQGPLNAPGQRCDGIPVAGRTLIALDHEAGYDAVTLAESKQLMRAALAQHLGNRPLRSRELFRQTYAGRHSGPATEGD